MNEFNNNDLVTDWDLTAFTSSQKVNHARPSLFTGDKEDVHALNGMDIFNTPPHLGENDEKFCTRNNVDSRLRFLNQVLINPYFIVSIKKPGHGTLT